MIIYTKTNQQKILQNQPGTSQAWAAYLPGFGLRQFWSIPKLLLGWLDGHQRMRFLRALHIQVAYDVHLYLKQTAAVLSKPPREQDASCRNML